MLTTLLLCGIGAVHRTLRFSISAALGRQLCRKFSIWLDAKGKIVAALSCRFVLLFLVVKSDFPLAATGSDQPCDLYPIALPAQVLTGAIPGSILPDIFNGAQPGNFGWFSWAGSPSESTLVKSLKPPGDSSTYVNPDSQTDHTISVGDWVQGKPAVSNGSKIRDALDALKSIDITVPVWDQSRGQGEKAAYRVAAFCRIRLISYALPSQNRITARFLGYTTCGKQNSAPLVSAGGDRTVLSSNEINLNGSASDDGLPLPRSLAISWKKVSGPASILFSTPNSAVTKASFSSAGTFVVRLTAGDGELSTSDDATITVNSANRPPEAISQSQQVSEDNSINITLHGTDPDGDILKYTVVNAPSYGTLSGIAPDLRYTPKPDFNGSDSFSFKVSDDHLESAPAVITLKISPINDAPFADSQSISTREDTRIGITLSGSDVEGSALSFSVIANPAHGILSGTAPDLNYTPELNYNGPDSLSFQVNDGNLNSLPAIVTIMVNPVNDAPLVNGGEDQIINFPNSATLQGVIADDFSPGQTSMAISWGKVSGPGAVIFANAADAGTTVSFSSPGIYMLRLTATDAEFVVSDEVIITVNQAPAVHAGPNQTATFPATVLLKGAVTDDGLPAQQLTVAWGKVAGPGEVTFANPGALNTAASFSAPGIYTLRLSANDSAAASIAEIQITINEAPAVSAGSAQTIFLPNAAALHGSITDDALTGTGELAAWWSKVSGPGLVTFTDLHAPTTTANFSASGNYILRLTANDSLASRSADVAVTVLRANRSPSVFAGPDQTTPVLSALLLNGSVGDDGMPAGSTLAQSWTQVSGPGAVTFGDPNSPSTLATFSEVGEYLVSLTASDSELTSNDTAKINVTAVSINQPPFVNAGPDQTVGLTDTAQLTGIATDDGAGTIVLWTKVSGPGTVTFAGGTTSSSAPITSAKFSERGSYVLRLSAQDAEFTASDDVIINVYPTNLPPTVNAGQDQNITINFGGKIVVSHDEWLLSDVGFGFAPTGAKQFALNLARYFTAGRAGKFLAYSASPALSSPLAGSSLAATMTGAGHSWTVSRDVDFSLPNLLQYDAIYLAGDSADNVVLIDYVNAGGNVFLEGGTGDGGAAEEAARWKTFLNGFGLDFLPGYNSSHGLYPIAANHPLFADVPSLYYFGGNSITQIDSTDPNASLLELLGGNGLFAVQEPTTARLNLAGSVADDGLPAGQGLIASWTQTSGPGTVTFSEAHDPVASASFSAPGLYTLRLTAQDAEFSASDEMTVSVDANRPPVVNAGADQTIAALSRAILNGVVHDDGFPTGAPLTIAWSKISGPGTVSFANANEAATTASLSIPGTYVLRLTASDSQFSKRDDVTINASVEPANQAPVVNAGNFQEITVPANTVALNASIIDDGFPTGSTVSSAWSKISGPGTVIFGNANALATTATFGAAGFYTLRLIATDSQLSSSGDVSISLNAPGNQRPTADAGPDQTITLPAKAILIGIVTDDGFPSSNPVRTFWEKISGPGAVTLGNTKPDGTNERLNTASFSLAGTYVLRFTACDDFLCAVDNLTIVVNPGTDPPPLPQVNVSPTVHAGPAQTIALPANTALLGGAIADDGVPSGNPTATYWIKVSGPGTVTFGSSASAVTTAGFSALGTYVLRLTGTDFALYSSDTLTVNVVNPANQPPLVNAGLDQIVTLGQMASLNGTATDDSLPASSHPTFTWSNISGPQTVSFSSPNAAATMANFSALGTYVLRLTATDSQLSSSDDITVTVGANLPPSVNAGPDQIITLPSIISLNGTATDDGFPIGDALSVLWTKVSGPGQVAFNPPGGTSSATSLIASATFSLPGVYVLRLRANDSQNSSSDDLTITVEPAVNQAPSVSAGPDQVITLPNSAVLTPAVSDDALPRGTLVLSWSQVSGPAPVSLKSVNGTPIASFSAAGTYILRLTVTDSALTSTDDLTVNVSAAVSVSPPPFAEITGPADSADITAPVKIFGTVESPILQSYQLQQRLMNAAEPDSPWTTFGSGNSSVANNVLGVFDPTLLLNGIYEIRLVANDTANRSLLTPSIPITVAGNMKVGNFTLSFVDLNVPVAGLPIQIIRTYDSRDKRTGDFGVGWTLDIKNIRLQKNRNLGRDWEETSTGGLLPTYCLEEIRPRIVSITFPTGKVYKFQAVPTPKCQFGFVLVYPRMNFVPLPGTTGSLVPMSGDELVAIGNLPGIIDFFDFNALLDPTAPTERLIFNPTLFQFTAQDGYAYVIDEKEGLKSMSDPNGNTLTLTKDGIIHSSGKSIQFVRDGQGRITAIIDPAGTSMSYTYDARSDLIEFQDRENSVTGFTYDGTHSLLGIRDPRGIEPTRNEYDAEGRLIRHIDAFGKTVNYTHSLDARQEIITDRLGNIAVHEYDERGNVVRVTDPKGGITVSAYDEHDNLISLTDPIGRTTTYTYDAHFNRSSLTDPLGHVIRFTYNNFRKVLTATDARGFTTLNSYDENGRLSTTRDPLGNITSFTHNLRGSPTSMTDAQGNLIRYEYNPFGHLSQEIDPDGNATVLTSDPNGNLLTQTVSRTGSAGLETLTTIFNYDKSGRLIKTTFPDGSTTETVYSPIGKPAIAIDRLGRQTSYEYDELGQLTRTVFPDGASEGVGYDAEGRRVTSLNRLGQITAYAYDAKGNLLGTTYPDGASTQSAFDLAGQLIASTDARGNTTGFGYDSGARQTSVINALGQITTSEYDANANLLSTTDALGHVTTYVYDPLNRRVQTIYPDASTQTRTLDSLGRRIAQTDPAGVTTSFRYDASGRLLAVVDGLNGVTRSAYNELGQLISQTDANNHTTGFEYDRSGRRIRRILPGGQVERSTYNSGGSLISRTDFNGNTTIYTYDVMNRLTEKRPDPGLRQASVLFTYNILGQRTSMTDASGVTTYTYDNGQRLIGKTTPQGALDYSYDANRNLLSVQSSNPNGTSLVYQYDSLNRLMAVNDARVGSTVYNYDAVGNLQNYTYPNGVTTAYEYNTLNRLTGVFALDAQRSSLGAFSYTTGPSGHRLTASESILVNSQPRTLNRAYTYDAVYRLASETIELGGTGSTSSLTYSYDAVGNRLSRNSSLAALPSSVYQYDASDRLLSDQYDANGNTTSARTAPSALVNDTYDFENRLINRNNGQIEIVYDGDGNRVRKTVGGLTSLYLVDDLNPTGYSQVLEELVTDHASLVTALVTRIYTYGHDLLSQDQLLNNQWVTSFSGHDGHGSVRFLTDLAGNVTDTYDYDAFGNLISRTGSTPNDYLYSGEQFDPDFGLYYLRARYHNPDTGRFWSMDSFEGFGSDPKSLHKYTYCAHDPVNSRDPSGHISLSEVTTAVYIGAAMGPIIGALNRGLAAYLEGVGGKQISEAALDGHALLEDVQDGVISSLATLGIGKTIAYTAKGAFYAVEQGAPFLLRNTPGWVVKPLTDSAARFSAFANRLKSTLLKDPNAANIATAIDDPARLLTSGTDIPNAGGVIRSFLTSEEEIYYRVFSGDRTVGSYLTKIRPGSSAYAHEALALPEANTAEFIQKVLVPIGTRLQRSRALPAFGGQGGAEQFQLLERIGIENFGPGVLLR